MAFTGAAPAGLKSFVHSLHQAIGKGPRWLALAYLLALSAISRNLLSRRNQQRIYNSIFGLPWAAFDFAPLRVVLGRDVEARLVPHLGEFDEQALFSRQLDYEPATFAWLERAAASYDLIIEIGANVGVFTVFLDALRRRRPPAAPLEPAPRPQVIVSFEPSPEACRRLRRNLELNRTEVIVRQAAVGREAGRQTFYEPVGHLTNGSFVREFAAQFSEALIETAVDVVAAGELETWLASAQRALIKIDVEGFEPELLAALAPLLERYRPDLLIEVMPLTAGPLEALAVLAAYERFLVTESGLLPETALRFVPGAFDWFLTWRTNAAA
jgi:FkbM family methyltransferase